MIDILHRYFIVKAKCIYITVSHKRHAYHQTCDIVIYGLDNIIYVNVVYFYITVCSMSPYFVLVSVCGDFPITPLI